MSGITRYLLTSLALVILFCLLGMYYKANDPGRNPAYQVHWPPPLIKNTNILHCYWRELRFGYVLFYG